MRSQTSMEYLLILIGSLSLSVFVVGGYASLNSAQKSGFASLMNGLLPVSGEAANAMPGPSDAAVSLRIETPSTVYMNGSGDGYLIAALPSGQNLSSFRIYSDPQIFNVSVVSDSANLDGMDIVSFSLRPLSPGAANVVAELDVASGGAIAEYTTWAMVYSASGASPSLAAAAYDPISASIRRFNETERFDPSGFAAAYSYSMKTHCAYHNSWSGNREPEYVQCGYGGYGFIVSDGSCNPGIWGGYDRYYCVYGNATGAYLSNLTADVAYNYSISLSVSNSLYDLVSNLSSAMTSSQLFERGKVVGLAAIGSASEAFQGPLPYSIVSLRKTSGAYSAINVSYSRAYFGARAQLEASLRTYNGSWIGSDTFASITSQLNATDKALDGVSAASAYLLPGCSLAGSPISYYCAPRVPFSYMINGAVYNTTINATMEYASSVITLK